MLIFVIFLNLYVLSKSTVFLGPEWFSFDGLRSVSIKFFQRPTISYISTLSELLAYDEFLFIKRQNMHKSILTLLSLYVIYTLPWQSKHKTENQGRIKTKWGLGIKLFARKCRKVDIISRNFGDLILCKKVFTFYAESLNVRPPRSGPQGTLSPRA